MYTRHNLFPGNHSRIGTEFTEVLRRIVAKPASRRIIRRKADEIAILIVIGRTGLTGYRHGAELRGGTGTIGAGGNALEQVVEHSGALTGDHPVGNGGVFQDHSAVSCLHTGVGIGLGIDTAVAEDLIGSGQVDVRKNPAVFRTALHQGGDAQLVLQEVEAHLRGDDLLQLDRNGVGRALDRDIDGDIAQVGTIEVHRPGALYTVFCDGNGGILYQ